MHLADKIKNLIHLLLLGPVKFLGFFMVRDPYTPLEIADNFLVRDLTRLINLVIFKEGEPGL